MKLSEASKPWPEYHRAHSRENSIRAYEALPGRIYEEFGDANLEDVTTDKILPFINRITDVKKPATKRTRYSHLLAFFNFIKNDIISDFRNPCDTPLLKKPFRASPSHSWIPLEKDTVDEIIFRTTKTRNRLKLELMARGGMRIGEVLKLKLIDIVERKLILREP